MTERAPSQELERLHKVIANAGITSRRKAELLIQEGRVSVNGKVVMQMGTMVGPEDMVSVDGLVVPRASRYVYVILNKPKGYVTTMDDPQGRAVITQLLPDLGVVLKPVGRLDRDTEGLLLCTNDGQLASRLSHPRYGVQKEYEVSLHGELDARQQKRLETGVFIDGRKTAPAKVEVISIGEGRSRIRMTLQEGRNRQIRKMGDAVGHPVTALRRVRYGPLVLKRLPVGGCRTLGVPEVALLRKLVGLKD
ncbi:MAG: rRNA pseudouridine synthase [Chthonomonas sp.]|nr:rRNA pseudouridine synthase [Chthonomonas sp.]